MMKLNFAIAVISIMLIISACTAIPTVPIEEPTPAETASKPAIEENTLPEEQPAEAEVTEPEPLETTEPEITETETRVGEIQYAFDSVVLNESKNNFSKVNIRYVNTGAQPAMLTQLVQFKLKDLEGKIIGEMKSYRIQEKEVVGLGYDDLEVHFPNSADPGTYTLTAEFYTSATREVQGSMEKQIQLGEDAEIIQWNQRRPQLSADMRKMREQVEINDVQFEIADLQLNGERNTLDAVNIRFKNIAEKPADIDRYVKIQLLDSQGTVINARNPSGKITALEFIGTGYSKQLGAMFYELQPGTYTVRTIFYEAQTNNEVGYVTRAITVSPEAELIQKSPYIKREIRERAMLNGNGVEYKISKIRLNGNRSNIIEVDLEITNNGEPKEINTKVKILMVDGQSNMVNGRTAKGHITKTNYTGVSTSTQAADQFYNLPEGEYIVVVDLYESESNQPKGYVTKKIKFGPDEASEQ